MTDTLVIYDLFWYYPYTLSGMTRIAGLLCFAQGRAEQVLIDGLPLD
ncbi:MAG: hypothetical protein RRB22_01810 [Gammaproteobacteria bacterium]|nr:hypothetical protein [Gammaproteobacteria bacterium]